MLKSDILCTFASWNLFKHSFTFTHYLVNFYHLCYSLTLCTFVYSSKTLVNLAFEAILTFYFLPCDQKLSIFKGIALKLIPKKGYCKENTFIIADHLSESRLSSIFRLNSSEKVKLLQNFTDLIDVLRSKFQICLLYARLFL